VEDRLVKTLRDYFKIAKAADFLGVSQTTLRKWADDGEIPVYVNRANGYRLFLQEDLEKFLSDMAKPVKRKRPRPR
jgi:excisionase family DNA binding protein